MSIERVLSAYSYYASPVYSVLPQAEKQEISDAKNQSENPKEINDTATISDEAMKRYSNEKSVNKTDESSSGADSKQEKNSSADAFNQSLTSEEQKQVAELQSENTRVKAHEQAHLAASAGLNASSPSYEYKTGPDGKKYAISGEVSISFSKTDDPDVNLERAQAMKRAAMAPSDPSSQDRSVAAKADQLIAQAREEISKKNSENSYEIKNTESSKPAESAETSDTTEQTEKAEE